MAAKASALLPALSACSSRHCGTLDVSGLYRSITLRSMTLFNSQKLSTAQR